MLPGCDSSGHSVSDSLTIRTGTRACPSTCGYKLWTRVARRLQAGFEGQMRGLGPAVFQWLVMRQGVDTVKPDVHVHRFAEAALGRLLSDADTVEVVVAAAHRLGMKAYELDWAIWEHGRGGPAGV